MAHSIPITDLPTKRPTNHPRIVSEEEPTHLPFSLTGFPIVSLEFLSTTQNPIHQDNSKDNQGTRDPFDIPGSWEISHSYRTANTCKGARGLIKCCFQSSRRDFIDSWYSFVPFVLGESIRNTRKHWKHFMLVNKIGARQITLWF